MKAGPERTVWGSDWPHTTARGEMPVDAGLWDILATWAPSRKPGTAFWCKTPRSCMTFLLSGLLENFVFSTDFADL